MGQPVELAGKVVVAQFFATYCFPCLVMLPRLKELQDRYGHRGLQAVGVGMDLEGSTVLEPFAERYQLPFPLLIASDEVRQGTSTLGPIGVLPSTVVLDRDGRVVVAVPGVVSQEDLDRAVEKFL
jgi:peroxiredoxin